MWFLAMTANTQIMAGNSSMKTEENIQAVKKQLENIKVALPVMREFGEMGENAFNTLMCAIDEVMDNPIFNVITESEQYVIELSDDELKIVTAEELADMEKSAMEFDGFLGFTVRGRLVR